MSAITTFDEFLSLCSKLGNPYSGWLSNGAFNFMFFNDAWGRFQANSNTAVAPSSPVVPNNTHAHALIKSPQLPGTSSKQFWLSELEFGFSNASSIAVRTSAIIYDRLSHQGGLSGTVTTDQTTNLPTAALTRYTSGEGVQILLSVYTNIGGTGTTVTASYTNQSGVSGRTTQPIAIGGSISFNTSDGASIFTLQDGDTGVRSVESVTLAGTTGTAGNLGVALIKPLAFVPMDSGAQIERQAYRNQFFGGNVVEVLPDACLGMLLIGSSTSTGVQGISGRIGLAPK